MARSMREQPVSQEFWQQMCENEWTRGTDSACIIDHSMTVQYQQQAARLREV